MIRSGDDPLSDRDQTTVLTRTFLLRFFENEITSGTDDLKGSFFWLLSLLATPGMLLPFVVLPNFELIARIRGVEVLRVLSRGVKAFYIGLAIVGAAMVAAVVWRSLLIDRRDALVLGSLPVRSRSVIAAKLFALTLYVGMVIVAMHAAASIGFGLVLASNSPMSFAVRGVAAHFVASSLAGLFVFALAIAVQGSSLALVGPRAFGRMSGWLQLALVGAIVLELIALPVISGSTVQALAWNGDGPRPWLLSTPPLWFLGLYETILGTGDPLLIELSRTGLTALAAAAAVAVVSFPLAYRRVMSDAVERPGGIGRVGRSTALSYWLAHVAGRDGTVRAAAQFFLATIGRVEHHRFTMAIAAGAALAWGLPTVAGFQFGAVAPARPSAGLLALPLSTMVPLLAGLHVAASLPSDMRAAWMFHAAAPAPRRIRSGARRMMLALGVAPIVLLSSVVNWRLWGAAIALQHALVCIAVGALVIEYFVRDVDAMPCARRLRVDGAHLRAWWAAYLLVFVLLAGTSRISVPTLAGRSFDHPVGYAMLVSAILLVAAWLRFSGSRGPSPRDPEEEDLDSALVQLRLN